MTAKKHNVRLYMGLFIALLTVFPQLGIAETTPLTQLRKNTHFHGIAADSSRPGNILLATHHGFYTVAPNGQATRLSEDRNDYMGFTPHPSDEGILYASGHPARGGNMGFLRSTDGGKSWQRLAKGVNGPVDYHQMDISSADPNRVYGVFRGQIQISEDGGKSWRVEASAPDGLIDLAASALDPNRLYAATDKGLLRSGDGGKTWRGAHMFRSPATMVHTSPNGDLYAFMVGRGLLHTKETKLRWKSLNNRWGGRALIHLTIDPKDAQRLYAITNRGEIVVSRNGGSDWSGFGFN